jgi:hypothetical protein
VKIEAILSFAMITFLLTTPFSIGALSAIVHSHGSSELPARSARTVLILECVPNCEYTLTVHVVDSNTNSSISEANVIALGPQNLSGITDGGTVVFNKTQEGNYTVTASKIG